MLMTDMIKFIVAMIIMMNPLGSLSIFLDLTHKMKTVDQKKIAEHASIAIIIIMLLSLWTGRELLDLLGITVPAFRVAVVLFYYSWV